jgi:ABC-type nitrate/sulfonate/bicarbonate transport system substrate-binding protein
MSAALRKLLATAAEPAERIAARQAWVRETAAALREAQRAMDQRCEAAVDRLSEEAFERLFDEEQAKVKAFLLPLRAAAERDVWPRELYWGGI